uniref:Uncharacterized protein n=1 Tax=Manihot esculenta TaxID=3983 RepID=A0A2C9U9W8_MANES
MQTRNAKNRVVTKLLWLETTVSFKDLHEAEKKKKIQYWLHAADGSPWIGACC